MQLQALLLLFLVSASLAGPSWMTSDSCTTRCLPDNKFSYEVGKTYIYEYEALTTTTGEENGEVSTKFSSNVLIQPVSSCEIVISFEDVVLNSKNTKKFARALMKEPTKFSFQNGKVESVCSSQSEPVWVSNIKKGVISAFQNSMESLEKSEVTMEKDISGDCETEYTTQNIDEHTVTIFKTKDLKNCKNKEYSTVNRLSALGYSTEAFLSDLPLLDSHQTCKQHIANGIVSSVKCNQSFQLRPFKSGYIAETDVSTKLNLHSVTAYLPNQIGKFDRKSDLMFETFEKEEETSSFSAVTDILYRLEYFTDAGMNSEVPVLFSELVTKLRMFDVSEIQTIFNQNDKIARQFLKDALILVKTPSSMKMIINLIEDNMIGENDALAWITSLSFVKNPTLEMLKNLQPLVQSKYGTKAMLGLSSMIYNYCLDDKNCEEKYEVIDIITSIESNLGNACRSTTEKEKYDILLALKALGNAGVFKNSKNILIRCYTEENPTEIRIAAIEAWRRTPSSYDREHLIDFFMVQSEDTEVRIAAYLAAMKYPTNYVMDSVKESLIYEGINQVVSFVWTHLINLQESSVEDIIGDDMLQNKFNSDALKMSSNYKYPLGSKNSDGKVEANLIFSSESFLPRSAMFNLTVDLFGESINLFEFGGRMEGFETYIAKFFGEDGYYPEETLSAILKNLRQSKNEDETVLDNYLSENSDNTDGSMYLKIFGNELLYNNFNELSDLLPFDEFENPIDMIIEILKKGNVDLTKSFSILDTDINYPTICGLPLNLNLNGAATLGMKIEGNYDFNWIMSMDINGKIQPSAAIKIEGSMGIDAFVSKSGVKIAFSMHSSTLIQGKVVVQGFKVVDVQVDVPKDKIEVIDIKKELYRIEDGEEIKTDIDSETKEDCQELLGMKICYIHNLSEAKLVIEKTDTHTSYKFLLENEDNIKSLLFEMPNSQNNIKYSAILKVQPNNLIFNLKTPWQSLDTDVFYNFRDGDSIVNADIFLNNERIYIVKSRIIENEINEKVQGFFSVDSPFNGNLLKLSSFISNNKFEDKKQLKIELTTFNMPVQSLFVEYSKEDQTALLDMKTIYMESTLALSAIPNGVLFNSRTDSTSFASPKTITGKVTLEEEQVDEGIKYSGELSIKEYGLDSLWEFVANERRVSGQISGNLLDDSFTVHGNLNLDKSNTFLSLNIDTPVSRWGYTELIMELNCETDENDINSLFDYMPDNESMYRSKRSLNVLTDVRQRIDDMKAGFHSLKVNIRTPYEKAKNVVFELNKKEGERSLHYERNDNFVDLKIKDQGKKKGISLTIKSATPGWELLALTGRLDLSEVKAYVSGHINEKKIELEGTGNFSEKSGTLKMTASTPFDKFKKVNINFDYNAKRKIVTFEAKSSSSDFHILLEFKRGLTVDIFVPHPEKDTIVKGKFSIFKGDLKGSSRFAAFKTIEIHYSINLGQQIIGKVLYERNGLKIFELDAEHDGQANTAHVEIHGRLNENHSMFHFHREQFKNIEAVFNRNGKEFKVVIKGSGDIPKSGKLEFTIDNSFRETPRHISGTLDIDRTTSPKFLNLNVEYPGSKLYVARLEYNINLGNLRKGDFKLHMTTPTKDKRIWQDISADWKLSKDNVLDSSATAGEKTFKITGKVGSLDTDLTIQNTENKNVHFVKWQINRRPKGRDYLFKFGKSDKYAMFEFHGDFDTIKNGDVHGKFIWTRFMKKQFIFNEKWSTDANGQTTGNGDFELGNKKGTTNWSWKRNAENRAAILHWEATSNLKNYNSANMHIEYSLAERMVKILIARDSEKFSFDTSMDNFSKLSSSNTIKVHLPSYGDGEITLSHDFTNPMAKSVKAVGSIGGKKISYIANWTRNENLTEFDFNLEVNSVIFGAASLHAGFNVASLKDATASLHYTRGDKFVTIEWHRKKTDNEIENEMKFSSSFSLLPTARIYVHVEWTKGFHLISAIEWKDKSINGNIDFTPGMLTASITTPFEKISDISFSLKYQLKMKNKTIVLHYARGEKKVDMEFKLNLANKKTGKLSFELTTPFKVLEHVTMKGEFKKGKFKADYKRNDIEVHFEGEVEIKLNKSKMHLKFTPPSGNPVDLSFSYDLQKFIEGKSKKSNRLIDFDLKVAGQTIHFTIDGFRNTDKIFAEVNGNTSLNKLSSFYVKVDSELNLTDRVGHFEVRANEFHFKAENSFEKRKNGFYARTALDSSLTKLPGLLIGFGKEGDNFIATVGYGVDREVTVSFKGKNQFKKGFSGKIDIPKRGINDLAYDVSYGFEGPDQFKTALKIDISEDRQIEVEVIYNNEGVKARVLSPLGDH